jgi:branched-chain amino acid transport system substrate-binding protein
LAAQLLRVSLATAIVIASCIAPVQAEILVGIAGPITGRISWVGDTVNTGAEMALAEINLAGGLLGETLEFSLADDYCDPEQAVAAANKLVQAGVTAVFGHPCSAAAIPASDVYAEAEILFMSSAATSPTLTERGLHNVFRIAGRDDLQGAIGGDYLVEHWSHDKIAILHDGEIYGRGLAEQVRKRLREHEIVETLYEAVTPGISDYTDVILKLRDAEIDVIYFGGFAPEAALIVRQTKPVLPNVQLVGGDSLANEDFYLIGRAASEGTLFTSLPDSRAAARVVAKFRATKKYKPVGATLSTYAAVHVWAEAVKRTGTLELQAVVGALRSQDFDTVLGTIRFDAKGDVVGREAFIWYVWQGGDFKPADMK